MEGIDAKLAQVSGYKKWSLVAYAFLACCTFSNHCFTILAFVFVGK